MFSVNVMEEPISAEKFSLPNKVFLLFIEVFFCSPKNSEFCIKFFLRVAMEYLFLGISVSSHHFKFVNKSLQQFEKRGICVQIA